MKKIYSLIFIFSILYTFESSAQTDSLHLNINQATQLLIANNYDLLVGNQQVNIAEADVITARLFENPELSYENLLYNHETKKFLQTSYAYGQYAGSISQLFKLAGKRNKNIALAKTGVQLAQFQYFDLMRSLRFELRDTFYKIYFAQNSVSVIEQQIASSEALQKVYEAQLSKGNIALKDLMRIKSLVIGLKSELTSALNDLEDDYRDIKLLMGISANTPIKLMVDKSDLDNKALQNLSYAKLLDSAIQNRADLKLAQSNVRYNEHNLQLQKAMAIPDVQLNLSYDLKGNYPEKYLGIGISVPIPLFNRNQGEIKKAKFSIDEANSLLKKQSLQLELEVSNSLKTAVRNENMAKEIDETFSENFNRLINGLIKNFRERNISLIEFLDLYESYKETTLQINQLQYQRLSAREEINFVTGSNIFK